MYQPITVVITCYKYEHFLPEAIDSLISQTVRPTEIIVVNDCPEYSGITPYHPTKCERVLEKYPQITYIEAGCNDPLLARKVGFDACKTEYIIFLDADDKLSDNYIENALQLLPEADVIYSDLKYFGEIDKTVHYSENINQNSINLYNFMHVGCATKKSVIKASHAFYHPHIKDYHEDWYFWRKILNTGFTIKKQVGVYHAREHDNNRSHKLKNKSHYQLRGTSADSITLCNIYGGNDKFKQIQTWKNITTPELPNHLSNDLDIVNHVLRTSWTDFIFFYNGDLDYDTDICEKLLKNLDHRASVVHNTNYGFLECTIILTQMFRNRAFKSIDELKEIKTIYV